MNYTHKYRDYNNLTNEVMDEQRTLDSLVLFYEGIPKKITKPLFKDPKLLAEYAFKEYTTYYVTFYKENKPFVCLNSGDGYFDLIFLDTLEDGRVYKYLTMTYVRIDPLKHWNENIFEPLPNNQIFLRDIVIHIDNEIESGIRSIKFLFKDEEDPEDKMIVTERSYLKKQDAYKKKVEETTEVNFSNNYFRAPKHHLDYEHLFDYENLLKLEDLHLNKETKEKVGLIKTKSLFLSEKDDSV